MTPWMCWWLGCAGGPAWFAETPLVVGEGCPPLAAPATPTLRVSIRVHLAQGVDPDRVIPHTRAAAAWWRHQGVILEHDGGWKRVSADPVLAGGSPADPKPILAPLAERLRGPAAGRIDVVVLPRLAAPDSPAAQWFDTLTGLTLAPALLERVEPTDPTRMLLAASGVDGPFTPTVFLGLDALEALPDERARFVLAHEVGHALGLPHTGAVGNLMGPGFPRCSPGLDADQRASLWHPAASLESR